MAGWNIMILWQLCNNLCTWSYLALPLTKAGMLLFIKGSLMRGPTEFCTRTDWSQNSCIPEKKESWCRSFRLPTSTLHHNFYHVRNSSQENSSGQNQITHREKTSLSLSQILEVVYLTKKANTSSFRKIQILFLSLIPKDFILTTTVWVAPLATSSHCDK